jgi:hypothetical protein
MDFVILDANSAPGAAQGVPTPRSPASATALPSLARDSVWWYFALAGLVVWQSWLTLTLFGREDPWQALTDSRPIVSGHHPLHLYHGYLGARSLRERGTPSCYDPAFQAGYPKTPVFDAGSRLAELFLSLVWARFKPEAYKVGFAVCCAILPIFVWIAGRGMGFDRAACILATLFHVCICWASPCRELLGAGDLDLLIAGAAGIATVGLLVKFHRCPGLAAWVGLVATGVAGWYSSPVIFGGLVPLLLVYYFSAGPKHGLFWHSALAGALIAPVLINSFWLFDWLAYWWIRSPVQSESPIISHRTLHTLWDLPYWGSDHDRTWGAVILIGAAAGIAVLTAGRERLVSRLLALGVGGSVALMFAGVVADPFANFAAHRLLVPTLWLAGLPAAYACVESLRRLSYWLGGRWRCALAVGLPLVGLGVVFAEDVMCLFQRSLGTEPLRIGLAPAAQEAIDAIRKHTSADSRILIEENTADEAASHWTPLLPLLTGRAFVGGLLPDAAIEHSYARLVDQNLSGRPVVNWSDGELSLFCRRYHIGWVLCATPSVLERFRSLPGSEEVFEPGSAGAFNLVRLAPASFFLRGQGRLLRADFRHIALADVVPEEGTVVLSMHYQPGLQASPPRVQIEKEPDARDPVPFVRLRVSGPVARITLTWNGS